jgi:hypothetical protein
MKKRTAILLLAISGFALSAEFTPASANRMDGKCCRSSDGGRSNRYHAAMNRAAILHRHSSTQGDRSQR